MNELNALIELQKNISESRRKGEGLLRGFWQCLAFFGFLGFMWFFFHHLVYQDVGTDKLPFIVISVFGLIVIAVLVGGDAIFFNEVFDREHDLENRQSALAAQTLGIPAGKVSLRFSAARQVYVLIVTLEKESLASERVSLETKTVSLTFRLATDSLGEAIDLLAGNKDRITRF